MCALDWKTSSRRAKVRALRIITAMAPLSLNACSTVGPASIDQGRTSYNQVIQDTSAQQTLLNIIRVRKSETPLFMDVTEVDAATTFQTAISGGPSLLGATPNVKSTSAGTINGAVGFITGGAQYQEAPTVRYQPLSGQALVAQVSTPMTAEALANLFSSDWPLAAVLSFSIDRLTPNFLDYEQALNAIIHLDHYGAIIITATPSSESSDRANKSTSGVVTIASSSPAKNDNLTIYYRPKHVQSQPNCDSNYKTGAKTNGDTQKNISALWKRLEKIYDVHDVDFITLSTKGSPKGLRPPIQTRSALGVMKAVAEPDHTHYIAVLKPESVRKLIDQWKHRDPECRGDIKFYVMDPKEQLELDELEQATISQPNESISNYLNEPKRSLLTLFPDKSVLKLDEIQLEAALESARRFMLIAVSDEPPSNAFVSVKHSGKWYYIFNDDVISKRTLALITQINTMLAVPPQSPPLTPTISVGAR